MRRIKIYLLYGSFIFLWWALAFNQSRLNTQSYIKKPYAVNYKTPLQLLSTLDQFHLKKALNGDIPSIATYLREWEVDAEVLELCGIEGIKHFDREAYLKGLFLTRQLESGSLEKTTFLPQTYLASSILLALVHPQQITALPAGFRKLSLFPSDLLHQIPCDISAETLYIKKPQLAIIADYSQPACVEILKRQGIPLLKLQEIQKLEDLSTRILELGEAIGTPLKAELLTIFVECAMQNIDNRLLALAKTIKEKKKFLYLNYHTQYSLPTSKTLTGQLLNRLKEHAFLLLNENLDNTKEWTIPIKFEQIHHLSPDCIIVSAQNDPRVHSSIYSHLTKNQKKEIFFVDQNIQEFPSQHIVLAYYELYQTLERAGFQ